VPLHHARIPPPLRQAGHIDMISGLEEAIHVKLLSSCQLARFVLQSKLS
jgi:hypothetical protein